MLGSCIEVRAKVGILTLALKLGIGLMKKEPKRGMTQVRTICKDSECVVRAAEGNEDDSGYRRC